MKFRLSVLLWVVLLCATLLLGYSACQKDLKIQQLELVRLEYEAEVGKITEDPVDKILLRRIPNYYFGDSEFAVRMRIPDLAKTSLFYFEGQLPEDGFPDSEAALKLGRRKRFGVGDIVLNIAGQTMFQNRILIRINADVPGERSSSRCIQVLTDNWQAQSEEEYVFSPHEDPGKTFQSVALDEPLLLFMRSGRREDGQSVGVMVWLETIEQ